MANEDELKALGFRPKTKVVSKAAKKYEERKKKEGSFGTFGLKSRENETREESRGVAVARAEWDNYHKLERVGVPQWPGPAHLSKTAKLVAKMFDGEGGWSKTAAEKEWMRLRFDWYSSPRNK